MTTRPTVRRRYWFVLAMIGAALVLVIAWKCGLLRESSVAYYQSTIEKAGRRGSVVFDRTNGKPERLFLCFKQIHGGQSLVGRLLREPTLWQRYTAHHDRLRLALQEQFDARPAGQVHFFFEGFVGEHDPWGGHEDVAQEVTIIDESLRNPVTRPQALDMLLLMLQQGVPPEALGVLQTINGAARFSAYWRLHGLHGHRVIHGADTTGHTPLVQMWYDRLGRLAAEVEVTDEEIAAFIAETQQQAQRDQAVRHDYLAQKMQSLVPRYGVGVLVLGADHFGAGVHYPEESSARPLETLLASIPNSRTVVIDTAYLADMLTVSPGTLLIGSNPTAEQIRLLLDALRTKD